MRNKGMIDIHCYTKMSGEKGQLSPKELVKHAYDNGFKAIAITDCGNVQAFPEAYREWSRLWEKYQKECRNTGKEAVQDAFLKVIYGLEGNMLTEEGKVFTMLIYAKNDIGIRNLYKIVTASCLEYCNNKTPMIPKAILEKYSEGLIICSVDDKCKEYPAINTNIEKQIEYVNPLRVGKCWPEYPYAEEKLSEICKSRVKELFGDKPNIEVRKRLERELNAICQNGYAGVYMIWRQIVKKSLDEGYPVGFRGSVGSSLVACLCGITEINPLSPESGGYQLPTEVFMGINLDKEPDIEINVSPVIQETVQNYIEELPGVGETCYGGTIATITAEYAEKLVEKHYKTEKNQPDSDTKKEQVKALIGAKKGNGIHPGGIIVCPEGEDIVSFTPLDHPYFGDKIITHFEYHDICDNLLKLTILGHDKYELLHFLQEKTGVRIEDIPLDDKKTLDMICDVNTALIDELPEFGSEYVRQIIKETAPKSFEDLVKISALSHGTDAWNNNQDELIKNKTIKLSDCIASRDDIMIYLMDRGLEKNDAYEIMESVRKGRGLKEDQMKLMTEAGIPDWYIQACKKIRYLFPKAHAVSYTMMAVRLAYYKMYYPEAYQEGLSFIG